VDDDTIKGEIFNMTRRSADKSSSLPVILTLRRAAIDVFAALVQMKNY